MKRFTHRFFYFWGFFCSSILLLGTYYLQNVEGFIPCPLCILQRFILVILGFLCLVGAIFVFKKLGNIFLSLFTSLFALIGILLSGRQVWLQQIPVDKNAECGASLQYLMHVLPFKELITKIFQGSSECAQKGWQFLHLSLASWSCICFIGFFLFGLFQMKRS